MTVYKADMTVLVNITEDGDGNRTGGTAIIPLEDGETLAVADGTQDVYLPVTANEPTHPQDSIDAEGNPNDLEWNVKDRQPGAWSTVTANTDEDGAIIDYTVTRMMTSTVNHYEGGWGAISPNPAEDPIDTMIVTMWGDIATLDALDARLFASDARLGYCSEVTEYAQ